MRCEYVRLGDPDKAEAPLLESLRIAPELKHSDYVRNVVKVATEGSLLRLGAMEVARGQYQAALKYYDRLRAIHPDIPLDVISMLTSMAEIQERLGAPQESVELLEEAMGLAEKASASGLCASIASQLGVSQESLGHFNDALASQTRALALLHESGGNPDYEWQIESRFGHVERALGRNEEALEHYRKSIDGIEHLRSVALNTKGGRAGILKRSRDVYAETADLLVTLQRGTQALEMAERGRARAFLDTLAMTRGGLSDQLSPEQTKREEALLARISALMKAFYEGLNRGVPKSDALREAKLGLLQDRNVACHHPYFWKAFLLAGDRK